MKMAHAELSLGSVLASFASEAAAAVLATQVMLRGLVAAAPLHGLAVERLGARPAAALVALSGVLLVHVVGAALTIPALVGVKRWKIQVNKTATVAQVLRDLPVVLRNFCISVAVLSASTILLAEEAVLRDMMRVGLPSAWALAGQTTFAFVVTELWFYHVHRLFHENKRLYALVHKLHHTWPAPVAIVATYAHPVEHIGCNLVSILLGPILCGAHPLMATAYTMVFAIGAYAHHSGYWSDDLGMHDYHHEAFNVNYGNAHLLDFLYGTYRVKGSGSSSSSRAAQKDGRPAEEIAGKVE